MEPVRFERLEPLIAPPAVLPRLLCMLARTDVNLQEVVALVKVEPGLVAKLLRICNSAYFAPDRPIADLFEAIQLVGLDSLRQFAVAAVCERCMNAARPEWGLDAQGLWRHSVLAGFAAEILARDYGADGALLFTAGLLHDFGKVALAVALRTSYGQIILDARGNASALLNKERQLLNIDHAELGGQLLLRWNFPPEVVWGVRLHHTPGIPDSIGHTAALVTVADVLAHLSTDAVATPSDLQIPGKDQAYEKLAISEDESLLYRDRVLGQADLIQKVVGIRGLSR